MRFNNWPYRIALLVGLGSFCLFQNALANPFPWIDDADLWWNTDSSTPKAVEESNYSSISRDVIPTDSVCTWVYIAESDTPQGIEVRVQKNNSLWYSAHWGDIVPNDANSVYAGAMPGGNMAMQQLQLELAELIPDGINPGDTVSASSWAMHYDDGRIKVWWGDCAFNGVAPFIVLHSPQNIKVEQGTTFVDPVNCESPAGLSCTVDTQGYVDTSASLGSEFTLAYTAVDSAGNEAREKSRTVQIVEPGSLDFFPWLTNSAYWWDTDPLNTAGLNQHFIQNYEYQVTAGDAICTQVNFPDDSGPITGIEVRLLVDDGTSTQWLAAHWGADQSVTPPLTAGSQHQGFVPPSNNAWHKMVVDLNGGLSDSAGNPIVIGEGHKISGSAWVAHRAAELTEVWWNSCAASKEEVGPAITFPDGNPYRITSTVNIDPSSLYECNDNIDGACTASINSTGLNTIGGNPEDIYDVTYTATDSDGNTTVATLKVIVDDTPPALTLLDANPFYVTLGEAYTDPDKPVACDSNGVDCAGFVTSDARTAVDVNVLGLHTVTYTYQWTPNIAITVTRDVIVRHHQRYEAELAAELHGGSLSNGAKAFTPVAGSVVSNNRLVDYDQNSPSSVEWVIDMPAEAASPNSTYELIIGYTCNCNAGSRLANVVVNEGMPDEQRFDNFAFQSTGRFGAQDHYTAELTVPMVFNLQPGAVTIKVGGVNHGPNIDYIELVFDDLKDNQDGTYTAVNEWDNVHPPEITLYGGDSVTLNMNDPYSEYGYICWDEVDGICTDDVQVAAWTDYPSGSPFADLSVPGTYDIAYTLTDSASNTATTIRKVQVIDAPAGVTFGGLTHEVWGMTVSNAAAQVSQTIGLKQVYPWWNPSVGTAGDEAAVDYSGTTDPKAGLDVTLPSGFSAYHGERVHGYITPRVTGNHKFFVSGHKDVELWINHDANSNSSPTLGRAYAELSKVAEMSDNGYPDNWYSLSKYNWSQNTSNTSADVYLELGKTYYIAAISKSIYRNYTYNSIQIAWQEPDLANASQTTAPVDGQNANVIPHGVLAPYVAGAVDVGPTIDLVSPNPLQHSATVRYDDLAECTDDTEANCVVEVSDWGSPAMDSENPVVGQYTITLSATDGVNTPTTTERTVNVVAYVPTIFGSLLAEEWDINGGDKHVSSLTSQAGYPNSPDSTGKALGGINYTYEQGDGIRLRGYLTPTESGVHTFWLSDNGSAQLSIGTNQYANSAQLIASDCADCTYQNGAGQFEWGAGTDQQGTVNLVAGQKYYIEVLAKRKPTGGGARVAVAWSQPSSGASAPTDGGVSQIVPASVLSPFSSANDQAPTIDLIDTSDPFPWDEGVAYQDPATCSDDIAASCTVSVSDDGGMTPLSNPPAGDFTITLTTTQDNSGQTSSVTRNVSVVAAIAPVMGSILNEDFDITTGGKWLSDLLNHAKYTGNTPDVTGKALSLDEWYGQGDGVRLHGYIIPNQTGLHRFWLGGNGESKLYLSADQYDANAVQIAHDHPDATNSTSHVWGVGTAQEGSATLNAGQKYYIRVLAKRKNTGGAGRVHVAWAEPGGTAPTDGDTSQIIPGDVLTPFIPAANYIDQAPTIDLVNTADPMGWIAGDAYVDPATCDDDINLCELSIIDDGGMTLSDPASGPYTITLQTSADSSGQSITVTRDVLVAGYAWGGVDIEYWTGIGGSGVSAIESRIASQATPNSSVQNYNQTDTENQSMGRFGTRIHGYLKAPYTGDYFFYLSCGHNCRLDIDIDGTDPSGVQVIKSQGQTGRLGPSPYLEPNFSGTPGTVVSLTAGDVVYFKGLQKAGWGNWRHFGVGWEIKDSGGTVLRSLEVIPGADLAPYE
ncbi:MAG: hypothetical protein ACJAYF_000374 [Arenicella sp.]|jgi:hypothetical protein